MCTERMFLILLCLHLIPRECLPFVILLLVQKTHIWYVVSFHPSHQIFPQHGAQKQNRNFRIPSYGSHRRSRSAATPLHSVPVHIPSHHSGKPAHHPGCHLWLPPPHSHVRLPLQLVLYWHLFKHNHDPKDASEHPNTESEHHIYRLPHPALLHPSLCWFGK